MKWRTWQRPCCFNPCFLGTCPQRLKAEVSDRGWTVFQSLFSWNLPSESKDLERKLPPCKVSILVFLELALREARDVLYWRGWWGFNPCFLGTCPQSLMSCSSSLTALVFQSLFSWNLPSESDWMDIGMGTGHTFQSLFSWNLPSESDWMDIGMGTGHTFQSLFSWNLPSEGGLDPEDYTGKEFQSLFSWNLPSELAFTQGAFQIAGFQYLFSWNLPSEGKTI